jgi:hypothetical protein
MVEAAPRVAAESGHLKDVVFSVEDKLAAGEGRS